MRAWPLVRITLAVGAVHALVAWLALADTRLPWFGGGRSARTVAVAWVALPSSHRSPPSDEAPGPPSAVPAPAAAAVTAAAVGHAGAASAHRQVHDWPVYPTRPPPPATFVYHLRQTNPGGRVLEGPAQLDWSHDRAGYSLRLLLQPEGAPPRSWTSDGAFDRAGLAPRRLVQRDGDRQTRRLDFEADSAVSPPAPGRQDRWSWLAQLAAIAEAVPGGAPRTVDLAVAGLRGAVEHWRFVRRPGSRPGARDASRAARLLLLVREPERPYDLKVEAWLDPARHHWPVALSLSTPPSRWTFYLYADGLSRPPES